MACLILSRLLKAVIQSLVDYNISHVFTWSDSIDCLFWIKTTSKVWNRYVQNRVTEIRSNLPEAEWKHCPGEKNPADIPSRGDYLKRPKTKQKWFEIFTRQMAQSTGCFNSRNTDIGYHGARQEIVTDNLCNNKNVNVGETIGVHS